MNQTVTKAPRAASTVEMRRLNELARATGLGDSSAASLELHHDVLSYLGVDEPTPLQADVLHWHATVLRDCGRTADAEPLYERSLELATKLRYQSARAHALKGLASLALRRGDLNVAAGLMRDALAVAVQCGERRLAGQLQQNLGIIADIRGNASEALTYYGISAQTFEETKDLQSLCWVLNNFGYLHLKAGRYADAAGTFERALSIALARGDLMAEGILEENIGELRLTIGEIDGAYHPVQRCQEIAELRGDRLRLAAALKLRGAYERVSGRPLNAVVAIRQALALNATAEDALLGAELKFQLALALRENGDPSGAQGILVSALHEFELMGAREWAARVRKQLTAPSSGRYW